MAEKRDYYEVLGVERSATDKELSEAYRRLALRYHPDRGPGDEDAVVKFKEAAEAFEVLSHPEKRAQYNRFGHAGLQGGAPQFQDASDIFQAFGDILGEGLFGDFFGRGRRRAPRGADLRCEVAVDLLEAARGTAKVVHFQRHEKCQTCGGSGARPGSRPETCPYCGGKGRVVQSAGFFSIQTACPTCHGSGAVVRHPCDACGGSAFVLKKVSRKVNIPAGVDNENRICMRGEGEPSPEGGPPGDVYCFVRLSEHPFFQRHGRDLLCQVPISYSQAALGATIEVPTLDGSEPFAVPAGTQPGQVFPLKGRGMPTLRSHGRGDLLVQIHVEVPKKLHAEHEELLRKLAEIENTHVTPKRKTFFETLKKYFQSG